MVGFTCLIVPIPSWLYTAIFMMKEQHIKIGWWFQHVSTLLWNIGNGENHPNRALTKIFETTSH